MIEPCQVLPIEAVSSLASMCCFGLYENQWFENDIRCQSESLRRPREPEELPGGRAARGGELRQGLAACARHPGGHVRKIRRFVTPGRGLRLQVAGQQVRAVGLEQQTPGGDLWHEREQVRTAALIVDPAGDADRKAEREVARKLRRGAGEAVRHPAPVAGVLGEDGEEVLVRVALVQEHGFPYALRQLELAVESLALRGARGVVTEVVEPAFPDRDHPGCAREFLELAQA